MVSSIRSSIRARDNVRERKTRGEGRKNCLFQRKKLCKLTVAQVFRGNLWNGYWRLHEFFGLPLYLKFPWGRCALWFSSCCFSANVERCFPVPCNRGIYQNTRFRCNILRLSFFDSFNECLYMNTSEIMCEHIPHLNASVIQKIKKSVV